MEYPDEVFRVLFDLDGRVIEQSYVHKSGDMALGKRDIIKTSEGFEVVIDAIEDPSAGKRLRVIRGHVLKRG
jgi:hypothetical protein